jgi:2-polyprenyl-6-methoxyphenol hydroxylase-like FAD-dependent oxidoreductase
MAAQRYDIITIGGGIAASSLAKAMAERGARVLVLERERQFKDRVRGEALVPWGVAEANELGICRLLKETCAHEVPYIEAGSGLRDLTTTTKQRLPLLSFPHQVMQETLLAAAEEAGAEVRRGVSVEQIECGAEPAVVVDGQSHQRISARLVIAADGRRLCGTKMGWFPGLRTNPWLLHGWRAADQRSRVDGDYLWCIQPRVWYVGRCDTPGGRTIPGLLCLSEDDGLPPTG